MNFIKKLFDFGFKQYITPTIAGIIQYILYAIIILAWLSFLFKPSYTSFAVKLIITVIFLPISMVGVRMWLEFIVAMTKVAENTGEIKDILKEKKGE